MPKNISPVETHFYWCNISIVQRQKNIILSMDSNIEVNIPRVRNKGFGQFWSMLKILSKGRKFWVN